jgi:hypothetical protein
MRRYQHRSEPTSFPLPPSPARPSNCQQGHEHGHLDPFPAAVMWAMTSRDGQQLVAIAVAQPGQDPDYRRPGRDGACGLRAGRLVTAGLSGWSLGRRTEFGGRDPADAAWHVNVAGRCSPPADPGLGLASSAWLVGRAGPGRGCHPKGCRTSHQRSCPPALVWPPGQGWRPPRRPSSSLRVTGAPSYNLLQGCDQGRSLPLTCPAVQPPGWPARRPQERKSPQRRLSSSTWRHRGMGMTAASDHNA